MTPDAYTISEHMLPVSKDHTLYVQEWGNKNAKTTFMFLHGGPGSGCNDKHKLLFDPNLNRVLFFDQRGAGKSLPSGRLKENSTDHLVKDINKILAIYKIKKVVLVGGSWGSTLALAYATKHPRKVQAMVLRGIFTGTQAEIDFLDHGHFRYFYPEAWEEFASSAPTKFQDNPAAYHGPRVLKNTAEGKKSAYAYNRLEGSIMSLDDRYTPIEFNIFEPHGSQIEVFYMQNHCFLPEGYILKNASKLTMPIWLIQGRYDMVCPPITAYNLHKTLPNSKLQWTVAGHSGSDRENFDATKIVISSFV